MGTIQTFLEKNIVERSQPADSLFLYEYISNFSNSPYSINTRQLHADVDDHHTEHLPADCVVQQQFPYWQCLHWWQRALLLLHLFNLSLDVTFGSVPLQSWKTGDKEQNDYNTSCKDAIAHLKHKSLQLHQFRRLVTLNLESQTRSNLPKYADVRQWDGYKHLAILITHSFIGNTSLKLHTQLKAATVQ